MYEQPLSECNDQSLIITVNQRLSAHLLIEYAESQQNNVFNTPAIASVNSWLKQQWDSCQSSRRLLEPQQVHWLWQQVIEKSEHTDFILPTTQISHLVNDAYSQMHGWQVPWEELAASDDKDHQTFLNWSREFDALLDQHDAITAAHLPAELNQCLDLKTEHIYLVGFQDMPPALEALFQGATHIKAASVSKNVSRTELSSNLTELAAMANWAKNLLDEAEEPIRVGCVIPELQSLRKQTAEIFHRTFQQDSSPMTPAAIYPFNISAGLSLMDYPMLRDAYEALLLLSENAISADKLRYVLASPYIFPLDDGMVEAAEFDCKIRDLQLTTLPLPLLQQKLKKYPDLKRATEFLRITPPPLQFPSEWAQSFIQQLETIGWPGSQSLSSEEYQLLGQWNSQLQALSRLDDFAGPVSLHTCLSHLHHLLNSATFQPQTDHSGAPIQVLGMLEAAGLPYDHLWVMGLDDSAWPPAAQSNPFIPQHMQKQYKLPHNSAEHELAYATELQASLINNATHTILSSPAQDNNSNKQPSALINAFTYKSMPTYESEKSPTCSLENFSEDYAPSLNSGEKLKGGTAIASNQAACAFRAFAKHRLGAQSPRDRWFGISPMLHGTLLHEVLERIWRELKSQQALLALNQEEQITLIQIHVNAVITTKAGIPARFSDLEKERLIDQINDWLNNERERPPFAVTAIEKSETIRFKGHEMTVRMDRIDQLPDQSLVILDYKTSRLANPVKWLASPPLESQLPFYACFSQEAKKIIGCGYAVINRDGGELKGYAHRNHADSIPLDTVAAASKYTHLTGWSDSVESWRSQLNDLMDAFIGGYAAVAPNPLAHPCDHCELSSLCRIEECEAT